MAFLDSIKDMLEKSIPDIVVKYTGIANRYETLETRRAGDRYVSAKLGTDTFESHINFSTESLLMAGFTPAEAVKYSHDKTLIPKERRIRVLEAERSITIRDYVEQNDYYRMLNGLPMLDDYEQIWLDAEVYQKYNIPLSPIHEIDHKMLISLESIGVLDSIIKENPDRKYLTYLGKRRIDISTARLAGNFQIMYFPRLDNGEVFYRDFMMTYEECREYFLTVIYNVYYSNRQEYYDNYLAFSILVMTINKLISVMLLRYTQREFYDVDTLRIFLDAYGIEYSKVFTFTQLKLVAKNLNILLQAKSTDEVFVDLLSLLGYSNFSIMKYYLIKQHIFDDNGKPKFYYKTVTDENGNEKRVLDESQMYRYYFVRTPVGTYNVQDALHSASDTLSYGEVTVPDPYWIEDLNLIDKKSSTNFNYIDTKYMDINIAYKMHSIVFETTYLTRLVLDKYNDTKGIHVTLPSITSKEVSLFDVFVLLICLLCKYYRLKPSIMKSPSKIMHILGYNFEADFEAIKNEIKNNRHLDNRLIKYIRDTSFITPKDVNDMFVSVRELESLLTKLMNETENYRTYAAYEKIYRTLLWTKLNDKMYTNSAGVVPDTYSEYLQDADSDLYMYYDSLNGDEKISQAIDYVTSKLMNMFSDVKFLNHIKLMDETQIEAIKKLLCFFKSYTVTMRDSAMILRFDGRYDNMVHFSSLLNFSGDGPTQLTIPDSSTIDILIDNIHQLVEEGKITENMLCDDPALFSIDIMPKDYLDTRDKLNDFLANEVQIDNMDISEKCMNISNGIYKDRTFVLCDKMLRSVNLRKKEKSMMKDKLCKEQSSLDIHDMGNITDTSKLRPTITRKERCILSDRKPKFIWS